MKAISKFILAVELDNEAAAWKPAAKYLDQAKTELEKILNIQKIMKITKIGDSK
ncbi:MAG: hypothetical protein NTV15_01055 [Candidatus Bathyarchaeota archaeon]|nr:hypothetical protein [Candidatus Bathyarchaeota archaeon]